MNPLPSLLLSKSSSPPRRHIASHRTALHSTLLCNQQQQPSQAKSTVWTLHTTPQQYHITSAAKSRRQRPQPTGTTHRIKINLHPIRAGDSFFGHQIRYHSLNCWKIFSVHSFTSFPLPTSAALLSQPSLSYYNPPTPRSLFNDRHRSRSSIPSSSPFHSLPFLQSSKLHFSHCNFEEEQLWFREVDGN